MSEQSGYDIILKRDENSTKFTFKYPWIITWGYDFDQLTIKNEVYKVKCKACLGLVSFKLNDRTSKLRRHIMDFFPAKHAAARQILKKLEVESPTAKQTNIFFLQKIKKLKRKKEIKNISIFFV